MKKNKLRYELTLSTPEMAKALREKLEAEREAKIVRFPAKEAA